MQRTSAPICLLLVLSVSCEPSPIEPPEPLEIEIQVPESVYLGDQVEVTAKLPADLADSAVVLEYRWVASRGEVEGASADVMYHAPVASGTDDIQVEVHVDHGVVLRGQASIRVAQVIVLKVDDLGCEGGAGGNVSAGWREFSALALARDLRAGLGVIGAHLEIGHPTCIDFMQQMATQERFEIWNHGYDHEIGQTRPDGTTYSEFSNTSVEYQKAHLRRTQQLADRVLGVQLRAFGAPGNATDLNTVQALADMPEIDMWFYGREGAGKLILDRHVNVEHPVLRPKYERFRAEYEPELGYLALQIHPGAWGPQDFDEFERILDFLDGFAVYKKPSEFHDWYTGL